MTTIWKRRLAWLAVAAAMCGGLGVSASAASAATTATTTATATVTVGSADAIVQDTRLFTGSGTAPKPPQALQRAWAQALQRATAAGYSGCEPVDESVEWDDQINAYRATVTLSCVRFS